MNIKHQNINDHSPGGQKAREYLPIEALNCLSVELDHIIPDELHLLLRD